MNKYMNNIRPIHFDSKEEWRQWLIENHSTSDSIWIFIQKKNSEKIGIRYNEALDEAICFGWIDGRMKRFDKSQFIQRFSPRRKKSKWSLLNKKRAEKLISEGKMTNAGYLVIEEAKRNGIWDKAYSSRGPIQIPDDLLNALKNSSIAYSNFLGFPNSARFMYIHWINDAKRENTRKRRISRVVCRSEKNLKPGIDL
jgi:uncharacterized protein YdeI (YjbR/CyaY-like superfamily)